MTIQPYDIVMLIVLVGATLWGAYKGLAWQVASLASIFLSYTVALRFAPAVAPMISAAPPWNKFLAMLIVYVGISLGIWLVFRFFSEFIEKVKLKDLDRQIGGVLGAAKGVLLCLVITFFAVTLLGERERQAIVRSRSGYYITTLLNRAERVMPRELKEVLGPYLDTLEDRLQDGRRLGRSERLDGLDDGLDSDEDQGFDSPVRRLDRNERGGWDQADNDRSDAARDEGLSQLRDPWDNEPVENDARSVIEDGVRRLGSRVRDALERAGR